MVRTCTAKRGLRASRIGGQFDGGIAYVANVDCHKVALAGQLFVAPGLVGGPNLIHAYRTNYVKEEDKPESTFNVGLENLWDMDDAVCAVECDCDGSRRKCINGPFAAGRRCPAGRPAYRRLTRAACPYRAA